MSIVRYTRIRMGTDAWYYHERYDIELMRLLNTNNENMAAAVMALLERYENPISPNAFGGEYDASALEVASEKGMDDIVLLLLDKGANPNINQSGYTPLLRAANVNIARMLLQAGADINACEDCGYTALMFAAMNRNFVLYGFLLGSGADPTLTDEMGKTANDYYIEATNASDINVQNLRY